MPLPQLPRNLENLPDGSGWVPVKLARYRATSQNPEQEMRLAFGLKARLDRMREAISGLARSRRMAKERGQTPGFFDLPPHEEH